MTEPQLLVREVREADAEAVARLFDDLGHPVEAGELARRIGAFVAAGESGLVAEAQAEAVVVGVAVLHITPVLHRPSPVGRITALVVARAFQGRGAGRTLVEAAEARLRAAGCGLIEVTSNNQLREAHAFYGRLGFEKTSSRFFKPL